MKQAKAIFLKGKNKEPNTFAVFTSSFVSEKKSGVRIGITACSYYRLYINGTLSVHGPARSGKGRARVDEFDITPLVTEGKNRIDVQVAGYHGAFGTVNEDTAEPNFLIAEITEGDEVVCKTDESWSGKLDTRRQRYARRHSHCRQVTEIWNIDEDFTFDDLPDHEVEEVECPVLIPRRVPYADCRPVFGKGVIDCGKMIYDGNKHVRHLFYDGWNEKYAQGPDIGLEDQKLVRLPSSGIYPKGGSVTFDNNDEIKYAVFDLKQMQTGFIDLSFESSSGATVDIVYSDRLERDGDISARIGYSSCIRVVCGPGLINFTSFEVYAMRYIKVIIRCGGKCTLDHVGVLTYTVPDTNGGSFLCSDENVNRIYEAAKRTLIMNTLDVFMDCPDRERSGWLCDSLWTARAARMMLADSSVEAAMIENFLFHPSEECFHAFFPACYPACGDWRGAILTTWSFWLVIEIGEYYRRTGDRGLIDRFKPRLEEFFDGVESLCGEHGLYETKSVVFVDWSLSNEHDYVAPISSAANVLYACALETIDFLYGNEKAAKRAAQIRSVLKDKVIDRGGYDPRYIMHDSLEYKDGSLRGKPFYSEAAQYTMLWGELFNEKECEGLVDAVVNELGPCPVKKPPTLNVGEANMFIGLCIRLDMLSKLGKYETMYNEIRYLCDNMIKEGPGTLWETVSGESSRCHGFMAHIGVLLARDILGLHTPETYPKKAVTIAPHTLGLRFAQGSVNTDDGVISVYWKYDGRSFDMSVTAPDEYEITLRLPREVRCFSKIALNGKEINDKKEIGKISGPFTLSASDN